MLLPLLGLLVAEPLVFAPGSSPEFQEAVKGVSSALDRGDAARAGRLMALLPARSTTFSWDDSAVPKNKREEFAQARDAAMVEWRQAGSSPLFGPDPNPAIRFRFSPVLAPRPQDKNPLGVALFFYDKATPRLEAFIGLKRGPGNVSVDADGVKAAVRYTLARYLGLADRDSGPLLRPDLAQPSMGLSFLEMAAVDANFRLLDTLGKAVRENKPVQVGSPHIVIDPAVAEVGTVIQGDRKPFSIQISNTGDAPLSYTTRGDCGCVVGAPPGVIPPGGVALIQPQIDSTEYVGKLVKKLIITTNDPERPTIEIPVKLQVTPIYRFLTPQGDTVVVDQSNKATLYLSIPEDRPFNILKTDFSGFPAKVTYTPWEGELADPALNEPVRKRKGYRIDLEVQDDAVNGHTSGTLAVVTDNPKFRLIRTTVYAQRGIAAMPDDVYLGAIGDAPKQSFVTLSRPNRPFKVLGIDSDNPRIKATAEPQPNGEVRITVTYDGKQTSGEMDARLSIRTDDPKQPKILVIVRGFVP
ncbi:hypothetical protein BH11ARM2_BH11ARM2_25840 [soil metagenome]